MIIHTIKYCRWGLYFVARMDLATMPKTQSINQSKRYKNKKQKETNSNKIVTYISG